MPLSQKGGASLPLSGFVPRPLRPDCQLSFPKTFVFPIPQPLKLTQTFIFLLTYSDLVKHLFSLAVLTWKGSVLYIELQPI